MAKPFTPLEDRFWPRVVEDPATGCWNWTGCLTPHGYGLTSRGGRHNKAYAHRVAYELVVGKIPVGLTLDHLCRNRRCCNAAHLEPVTQAENNLRGNGWSGRNARKTHCKRGHPLSGANLSAYGLRRGQRTCLTCQRYRRRAAA